MTKCVQLIAEAYDKYLSEHIPDLAVLPVKVSLSLLSKGITLPDVQLQPFHSVEDIIKMFKSKMIDRGDKIVHLPEDARLISFGLFMKKGIFEMEQAAREVVNHGAHNPDILILPPASRPLLQFALKPSSVIALYGKVQCESDLPKQCFATTFQKDAGQKVDYFSCKDCKINWVCRPCMDVCHKEHSVTPHIMGHQPTWACCYCPKKKKCRMLPGATG